MLMVTRMPETSYASEQAQSRAWNGQYQGGYSIRVENLSPYSLDISIAATFAGKPPYLDTVMDTYPGATTTLEPGPPLLPPYPCADAMNYSLLLHTYIGGVMRTVFIPPFGSPRIRAHRSGDNQQCVDTWRFDVVNEDESNPTFSVSPGDDIGPLRPPYFSSG